MTTPVALDVLDFPGQFCVWSARQWIQAHFVRADAFELLVVGFERIGAPAAVRDLDRMFQIIATAGKERLDFECPRAVTLGDDEVRWLRCLAGLQAARAGAPRPRDVEFRRDLDAQDLFTLWLPPTAARLVTEAAAGFVARLAAVGMWIRDPVVSIRENRVRCVSRLPPQRSASGLH